VILKADWLAISTARIAVGETTYAVRNLTSSRIIRTPKSSTGLVVAGMGALLSLPAPFCFASPMDDGSIVIHAGLLAFGLIMLMVGASDYSRTKDTYWIGITTSGAEVRAMSFADSIVADVVLSAINAAIAGRRVTLAWPELPDTTLRSLPIAIAAVVVPTLLAILHNTVFGAPGLVAMVLLILAGAVVAVLVIQSDSLRTKSTGEYIELLRSNKLVTGAVIAAVVLADGVAIASGVGPALARRRIDAAIAGEDPCAHLDPTDLAVATEEQETALSARGGRCSSKRAEAMESQQAEAKEAQKQACAKLLAGIQSGTLSPADAAAAGVAAELAGRISRKAITASDIRVVGPSDVPCAHSRSQPQIWKAYASATVATPGIWGNIKSVGDLQSALFAELLSGAYALPQVSADAFWATVDPIVQTAAKASKVADMAPGKDLCDLASALEVTGLDTCTYLVSKYKVAKKNVEAAEAAQKAREEAVEKAKAAQEEAVEKAKAARCEAIVSQLQACLRRCDSLLLNGQDEAALNCDDRCLRQFSA
jgi:hypothetical protein